ncbi:MAG: hypothetical protein N2050_04770 [Flavobacteriales bacterium]|nr:hypothetical protein [Flavobacteriales bacterium]
MEREITCLIDRFITENNKNLHFIIDEKVLRLSDLLIRQCQGLKGKATFNFPIGQKVISLKHQNAVFTIYALHPEPVLKDKQSTVTVRNLNGYIPLSNSDITQLGTIRNRITDFKRIFQAEKQSDFFCNEKLLVIGNRNLFLEIPKEHPACFVWEKNDGEINIEYNSPLLPKIAILKNINILDKYIKKEINGDQLTFSTCIFIGSSKFENSINIIRNYYNQRRFSKVVFIGEKDIKIDLGNNHVPLRWKWTIPEIKFFRNERNIQHEFIIVQNGELEKAITEFYQAVKEIENKHTIGLKPIYRFIRRLYYDWNLRQETTIVKLQQIQQEFDIALKQLLIETLGNIFTDFDFEEYQKPLSAKFAKIIEVIKTNNKTEKLKYYQKQIHQLILPSFLSNINKRELDEIASQTYKCVKANSLQAIKKLQNDLSDHLSNPNREYYSFTANGKITEIVSLSKSDDSNEKFQKIITSIYGSGKVEKLIEKLARAKTEYKLLLYSIEEKALQFYLDKYHEALNKEYVSADRYSICGVEFNDPYYQYTNFDNWLKDFFTYKTESRETDIYRITFTDNSKYKLPATKTVLKIQDKEKLLVLVEDLNVGDKVIIYSNPDKETMRAIFELKNPELQKTAEDYSIRWRTCLKEACQNNITEESLYQQLKNNHFSVSELTFRKYLEGEVMFPRSFADLLIIAKTINDPRLSFDFLKNTMKPKIEEYRGKEIEYGFKFSNSINHYIITGEVDEFISEWLKNEELDNIVSQIPVKTIKEIELITTNNDD